MSDRPSPDELRDLALATAREAGELVVRLRAEGVEVAGTKSSDTDIVTRAHDRLRGKVRYAPIGFELLPGRFTLTQLQRLYELVLGSELDKRNFRKKILAMDLLVETDQVEQGVRHRAARLYRFDKKKYEKLTRHGFSFAI